MLSNPITSDFLLEDNLFSTFRFFIDNKEFYSHLALTLKHVVAPNRLLLLEGEVGTGKTLFARILINSLLDAKETIPSPTFSLLQQYLTTRGKIVHADLYRLSELNNNSEKSIEAAYELGLLEELASSFLIIEWARQLPCVIRKGMLAQAQVIRLSLLFSNKKNCSESRIIDLRLPTNLVTEALRNLQSLYKGVNSDSLDVQPPHSASMPPSTRITQAFVLAAGYGTRMRSYAGKPKPLITVGGRAILLHIIDKLRRQGIDDIYINSHYRAEVVTKICTEFTNVTVLREETLLETGGGIRDALPLLGGEAFFAINGDALWYDPDNAYQDKKSRSQGQATTLLACLARAWEQIDKERLPATILLALVEEEGACDFRARDNEFPMRDGRKPFPLFFQKKSEHTAKVDIKKTKHWRYIGLQVLTARAFCDRASDASSVFSLREIYEQESRAGRLYGIVLGKADTVFGNLSPPPRVSSFKSRPSASMLSSKPPFCAADTYVDWRGVWMHVSDKVSLLRARRLWSRLNSKQQK